ncbi:MAG: hypothetical protein A2X49_13555 [Lentisphaerae bacterium GWF2_52_8]|nr:MAG: hypothetical protein A2X49_13555 [Lentisphaerae bacterium GWF2_52_8]
MGPEILGALAALGSSAAWAVGSILWRNISTEISSFSMNLGKGIIGCIYLSIVCLIVGLTPMDLRTFLLLGVSGIIGISIGDTFYFMSLKNLGPRLSSLIGALTPVFIALSAVVFLTETSSFTKWAGILLTVSGVTWVMMENTPKNEIVQNKTLGIKYGLLGVLCTTIGVLITKSVFDKDTSSTISPIQVTFIRAFSGTVGLAIWGGMTRQLKDWVLPFRNPRLLKNLSIVVANSVFGGFFLSILALKFIDASIASTLGSISPLFILPMVALVYKEKIKSRAVIGAVVAIIGISFIFGLAFIF